MSSPSDGRGRSGSSPGGRSDWIFWTIQDDVDEALGTGAEKIATGCPFSRVMFNDGLTQRQSEDKGTNVEILDVSQMLLASVKRGDEPRWSAAVPGVEEVR